MVLTNEKIKDIEAKAQDILKAYFSDRDITFPIPVQDVAQKNGLTIHYGNFKDDTVSGIFQRRNGSGDIYVAADEPQFRQAFTIGHELGHFILHPDKEEVLYRRDTINLTEEQRETEAEANWFAAALLMPEDEIRKYWTVSKDVQLLADYFNVSPIAVRLRIKNLGLE